MLRALKILAVFVVLIALGVIGYAYFGDLSPTPEDRSDPVELNEG